MSFNATRWREARERADVLIMVPAHVGAPENDPLAMWLDSTKLHTAREHIRRYGFCRDMGGYDQNGNPLSNNTRVLYERGLKHAYVDKRRK